MSYALGGQLIVGLTGIFLLGLAGFALANLRFRVPGSPLFLTMTLAGVVWCFGYIFEKSQTSTDGFMAAVRVEYLGKVWIPTLWMLIAAEWLDCRPLRTRWFRTVCLTVSALALLLVWTNDWHHLWYRSVVPTDRVGFGDFQPGPLYPVIIGLFISSFFVTLVLFAVKHHKTGLFRKKAEVILAANFFPLSFSLAYQFGLRPGGLDLTILSMLPGFLVLSWGLFRHDLIRLIPIARDSVVEGLENPVLIFDPAGVLADHNLAAREHLDLFTQVLKVNTVGQGELQVGTGESQKTYRFQRSKVPGRGTQPQGTVAIFSDITEERRLLDELAHQATHDVLTGLANRRHFESRALEEITRAGRIGRTLALVCFDLDLFKLINDQWGHQAGDKVLRETAARISAELRPYDLLARMGGEEFAILMPETDRVTAWEAAGRWREVLAATPASVPRGGYQVTASFGVAALDDLGPGAPEDPKARLEALMNLADRAMYDAKQRGRNRVC